MEHVDGSSDLLEPACVHHGDAIGDLEGIFPVVRHEHGRHARRGVEPPQPGPQVLADACVEGAEWLVEQQDAGLRGERAGERDPLPLPARELRRSPVREPLEPHVAEELAHAIGDARLRRAAHAEAEGDVLEDRHVLEERVVLEDQPHVARGGGGARHVGPVEAHRSRIRRLEPGEDAQERRLAATRGPEQREQLALRHLQRDIVERRVRPEALADPLDFEAHDETFTFR